MASEGIGVVRARAPDGPKTVKRLRVLSNTKNRIAATAREYGDILKFAGALALASERCERCSGGVEGAECEIAIVDQDKVAVGKPDARRRLTELDFPIGCRRAHLRDGNGVHREGRALASIRYLTASGNAQGQSACDAGSAHW
jgi:hypothetical protein